MSSLDKAKKDLKIQSGRFKRYVSLNPFLNHVFRTLYTMDYSIFCFGLPSCQSFLSSLTLQSPFHCFPHRTTNALCRAFSLLGDIKSYAKELESMEKSIAKALEIADEGDRNSKVKLINNQMEETTLALQVFPAQMINICALYLEHLT